jgi:uncharacterized damage-inducible protein DinB
MFASARIPRRFAAPLLACSLLAANALAQAPAAAPPAKPAAPAVGTPVPPAQVYGKLLTLLESEFVGAAEAMPEDKYNFAPTSAIGEFKGVRTFGEQVKHVAEANGFFFHDPSQPMVDNRADIDKLKTKAEIVKALKDSFVQAHAYVDSITTDNAYLTISNGNTRAGMAAFGIAHFMDHYGQMVEYMRLNGIVPPASRGSM